MNAKFWMASAAIAGGVLGAFTSQATAHTAKVTCGDSVEVPFLVTSVRSIDTLAGWTVTPGGVVVTWTDGYQDPLSPYPVPQGCTYPVPPPPPAVPEAVPPPAVVVTPPPAPKPPRKPPKRPRKRPVVIDCQFVLSHYSGQARKNMIRKHNIARSCGRPYTPPVMG